MSTNNGAEYIASTDSRRKLLEASWAEGPTVMTRLLQEVIGAKRISSTVSYILDIGAASMEVTQALKDIGAKRVISINPSLWVSHNKGQWRIDVIIQRLKTISAWSCEIILSRHIIEPEHVWVPQQQEIGEQISRILKPNGIYLAIEPEETNLEIPGAVRQDRAYMGEILFQKEDT